MDATRYVRHGFILVMLAVFCLSAFPVWANSDTHNSHETVENVGQAVTDGAYTEDIHDEAAHGGSLSAAKLKDLFWRILNFAALVAILVYFGAKPIASVLSSRQEQVKTEIEELEARRDSAERSYLEFEAKLAGMEKEIESVVERAKAQAEVEKKKILEKADQAAADIKRQAEMAVQNEITDARRRLIADIAEEAAVMAAEVIKRNLTADDQVKIIEDYLDKVGAVQ